MGLRQREEFGPMERNEFLAMIFRTGALVALKEPEKGKQIIEATTLDEIMKIVGFAGHERPRSTFERLKKQYET